VSARYRFYYLVTDSESVKERSDFNLGRIVTQCNLVLLAVAFSLGNYKADAGLGR
jgi:hypothetical protein